MRVTRYQRITIVRSSKPIHHDINEELQWLGSSLGLFGLRDRDKSCFRVFIELLKAAKKGMPLSSDELAERLKLSRGTVVHHLNRLMESGLVVIDRKRYLLRVSNLQVLVSEISKDAERAIEDLRQVAQQIDEQLGM